MKYLSVSAPDMTSLAEAINEAVVKYYDHEVKSVMPDKLRVSGMVIDVLSALIVVWEYPPVIVNTEVRSEEISN